METSVPETTWMTYDEGARALGIKADSLKRRAAARKWPRRTGNDGRARVGIPTHLIPPAITPDDTPARIPDVTPARIPDDAEVLALRQALAAATAQVEQLLGRLSDTREERDRAIADRDRAIEMAHAERERLVGVLERAFESRTGILMAYWKRLRLLRRRPAN